MSIKQKQDASPELSAHFENYLRDRRQRGKSLLTSIQEAICDLETAEGLKRNEWPGRTCFPDVLAALHEDNDRRTQLSIHYMELAAMIVEQEPVSQVA